MTVLVLGLILFFVPHSLAIVNSGWRDRMAVRLGEGTWKAGYSVVSALGVVLIVWGYGLARQEPLVLYMPPTWLRHVSLLLMLAVFPLLLAAYLPGRIRSATKHPMLVAVKVWALAHLLANGTVADVVLFGGFLVWAVIDRISLKRRPPGPMPAASPSPANDVIALVGGLAVYVVFVLWLHTWLIGVRVVG